MEEKKRKLNIDLTELDFAIQQNDPLGEILYFLDVETGQVFMSTGEERRLVADVHEQYGDPETGVVDWEDVLPDLDVPDWQKPNLPVVDRIESGVGTRYVTVPIRESQDAYQEMVAFIDTVTNQRLQTLLFKAVEGESPFRQFKNVLLDFPGDRQRWFKFQNESVRRWVVDWLDSKGIEPVDTPTEP
jgi:hypothetical protein